MVRSFALAALLLCSCSQSAPGTASEHQILRGVPSIGKCGASDPYPGNVAVLELAKPISFGSVAGARRLELSMPESYHINFQRYIGRTVSVACDLRVTELCGYKELSCGVREMQVER
jgi:hypothetical protein